MALTQKTNAVAECRSAGIKVVDIYFDIGNLLLLVIPQINLCCAGTELLIVRSTMCFQAAIIYQADIKFTYIIVSKRINTRFFRMNGPPTNPPSGTVVDDVVTLPER